MGHQGSQPHVTINPSNSNSAVIRYLMVSEIVEPLISVQKLGWFGDGTEGGQGEGLSRFLAAQILMINSAATLLTALTTAMPG